MARVLKRLAVTALAITVALIVLVFGVNNFVKQQGAKYIVSAEDAPQSDAILVLGAFVHPDGTLSMMLNDRLEQAFDLYNMGRAKKFIVSGDHGRTNYDEVNAMKQFLEDKGASDKDVFMDHAGFSTYESVYRARDIFLAKKVIIVTQKYHLMRAVFIARALGLEAYGVASDRQNYGEVMKGYEFREILARNKDFWLAKLLKPKPTFLGETIPVSGDGRLTDDKK